MQEYDVLIIGAGQAGIPLARSLAKAGKQVALVERKNLGGSCVNFGCTPTKAAFASARVAQLARRGSEFGLSIPSIEVDFARVLSRARGIAEKSRAGLAPALRDCGATILNGHARFIRTLEGQFVLSVDAIDVRAKQVVINTGTRTRVPSIAGLADIDYLHASNWLHRPQLPEHLVFVGAGAIALEMAQFYRRMRSQVTVIGPGANVAEHEDVDVSAELQSILEAEGIRFQLETKVVGVKKVDTGVRIEITSREGVGKIDGSHLFIATGRRPNTDDLGLDTVGIKVAADGVIAVNEKLATAVRGVWAAGDVRGGPMFTHTSWDDHRILESQLLGDGSHTTADRIVPYAIFTDPELGRVGLTETDARRLYGDRIRVNQFPMRHNGKAFELSETRGFIKLVEDSKTGKLLGAAVLATEGAELVSNYITLMNAGASVDAICRGIYIHPTLAEAVQSAAMPLTSPATNAL